MQKKLFLITAVAAVGALLPALAQRPAHQVESYKAKEIELYKGKEISRHANGPQDTDPAFFFRTFGLAVPGVAYTVDDYAARTRTLVTSAGALTKSAVRVHPDHTYEWNSDWDGRLIRGKWVATRDGSIILLKAQEGKDWKMQRMARPQGKAEMTLWDQNAIWYNGTPLAAK